MAKTYPPGTKLNKHGNRRGMAVGSKKTQFKLRTDVEKTPEHARTPQTRAQAKRLKIPKVKIDRTQIQKVQRAKTQDMPHRKVQQMIDDVYEMGGKSIKKSLMGMAQRMQAPAEELLRIRNADERELEKAYKENSYTFESYWDYPIYAGETRSDILDEILLMTGA